MNQLNSRYDNGFCAPVCTAKEWEEMGLKFDKPRVRYIVADEYGPPITEEAWNTWSGLQRRIRDEKVQK